MASQATALKELMNKMKNQKDSKLDSFMVIGIDFGTTYSGAAWATFGDFENSHVNLITTWPGTGREESKAPTELSYDNNRVLWGYSIPADAEPLRWFKLLLLRDSDLTPEMQRSAILRRGKTMLAERNKTATDVIADYLGGFWKHIITTISRARSKSVIDALTFHVVITVPAIWPNYAREGMLEAEKKAGILSDRPAGATTLDFAPEPEAAALASLWDRAQDLKTGDVYMVCDAGGGTVDLISYKVAALNPIQLHEAVVGTAGIKDIMKHEWEYAVKPQFSLDDPAMEYIVKVPAEAFTGQGVLALNDDSRKPIIKNGRIHFTSPNIQSAFDGAFHDIQVLTNAQINDAEKKNPRLKGIILVGGLGSSPYLYQYLQGKYAQQGIEILQSTGIRPRTAICRGAIFKGFLEEPNTPILGTPGQILAQVSVVSAIARKSIGTNFQTSFKKGIHREEDKFWDDVEGEVQLSGSE